jgi:hypothetical protein
VACNSEFDLVIAVTISVGLALAYIPSIPLARRFRRELLQAAVLTAVCGFFFVSRHFLHFPQVRLFFDPSFREEVSTREKAMADSVARVRSTTGDVFSSIYVCYRSGKPFVVDDFGVEERVKAGLLPKDAINQRVLRGTLTVVGTDKLSFWENALNPMAARK